MSLKRLLVTVIAFLPLCVWAQTAVIKGTLVNDKNVPMQNAVVILNGTNYQATTGSDGVLVLHDGEYRTGTTYRLWISPNGADYAHQQPFAIGEVEVSCLTLQFYYCDAGPQNQTITLL
jgi:hypothetical protein